MAISPVKHWTKALEEYVTGDRQEVVPEGWVTKKEIAAAWKKTGSYVNKILIRMLKSGKAERRSFIVRLKKNDRSKCVGYCRSLPHYKLKS
jgi:hypothetical protein